MGSAEWGIILRIRLTGLSRKSKIGSEKAMQEEIQTQLRQLGERLERARRYL